MQRKRSLSPTIWEDPSFNKFSRDGRLAFIGIISNADDDGYQRGDYGSLKRLIFGFDDDSNKNWYEELKNFKGLHFFEVNEETYVHLVNWEKYQNQRDDRRLASLYPKCPLCPASGGQLPDSCRTKRREVKLREVKLREEKGLPPNRGGKPNPSSSDISKGAGSAALPTARKGKPFYWDQEMRLSKGRWWVLPKEGGAWKEFNGKEADIVWK